MSRSLFAGVSGAVLLIAGFGSALPANAADWQDWGYEVEYGYDAPAWKATSRDETVQLRGSIGVLGIEAHEYVFAAPGSSNVMSHLIWQSLSPMGQLELRASLPDDFTVKGKVTAAIGGIAYMQDYDWFGPHFVSYHPDDWTHFSQHPNTSLDWYIDGSVAVGRDVIIDPMAKVNVNVGLKYTDVQWTAVGGSYIYSTGGFRDDVGVWPDDPAITYRLQIPVAFAGLDVEAKEGPFTFEGGVQGGVSFLGLATDDHWMRDLRFYDRLQPAPYLGVSASLAYEVTEHLDVFVAGSAEQVFLARADTDVYDGGVFDASYPDAAGAEIATVSASAGLKGKF